MSSDIVQRLRDHPHTMIDQCECVRCEAADRIATLTRTLATLAAECDEQGALVTAWRAAGDALFEAMVRVNVAGPREEMDAFAAAIEAWHEATQ